MDKTDILKAMPEKLQQEDNEELLGTVYIERMMELGIRRMTVGNVFSLVEYDDLRINELLGQ